MVKLPAVNRRIGGSSPSIPANIGELIRPGDGHCLENSWCIYCMGFASSTLREHVTI